MKKIVYLFIILISLILVSCSKKTNTKYYTIEFESYGGSSVSSMTVKEGSKLTNYEIPTKEGYIFSCWCLDKDATVAYNTSLEIQYNLKLYAAWTEAGAEEIYSINYVVFGYADEIAGQTGIKYLPEQLPIPQNVKEGFKFEGWYDSFDESNNVVIGNKVTSGQKLTCNLTLYAKFVLL